MFLSLDFVLITANSADPDEMKHHAAFHLGHHCLPKYQSFQYTKGQKIDFPSLNMGFSQLKHGFS